jgi:hypothetical protein
MAEETQTLNHFILNYVLVRFILKDCNFHEGVAEGQLKSWQMVALKILLSAHRMLRQEITSSRIA